MKYLNNLTAKLQKRPLTLIQFEKLLNGYDTFFNSTQLELELLISNGYPLNITNDIISLKTINTRIDEQTFCIVDIETSSPNINDGQIIEIGAIRYKNGQIIEKYQSLVNAYKIPKKVQEITSITPSMLENAPNLHTVLEEFKIFVEDDIIVAHNINFDYKYISDSLEQFDLGKLANRSLCTIDLSQKLFEVEKYGLKSLSDFFNIKDFTHHRAYDDAYLASIIFQKCLDKIPDDIILAEDLIKFSKVG